MQRKWLTLIEALLTLFMPVQTSPDVLLELIASACAIRQLAAVMVSMAGILFSIVHSRRRTLRVYHGVTLPRGGDVCSPYSIRCLFIVYRARLDRPPLVLCPCDSTDRG